MYIYHYQRQIVFRFLVLLCFLQTGFIARAKATQAGDEKVTIVVKNVPLRDVFKSITKQTGYHLFYSPEIVDVQERVSIAAKQLPVNTVLQTLLGDKNLTWVYNDDAIAIRAKDRVAEEKKSTDRFAADSITNPLQVTGKITDANGNAIPGATIMIKGTREGTTTDAAGQFSLPRVNVRSVLVVSSIGYEPREITVKGQRILAQLNMDVSKLDETVVIAYGTTTKRFNTGNVSTVKAEEIERQPVSNPLLALQGRVPGLFITQATGLSNSGVKVQIQGQNSIFFGNDPFYVIDGVPYSSQLLPNWGNILGDSRTASGTDPISGSPLSFINPADIESIEVLKDADATAIYGSRAANGAILITTKRGKVGQTKVDFNVQTGWGKVARKLNLMNTQQYLEMRHEALKNDGITNIPANAYDLNGAWDTTHSTDWQKELIGGTANYTDAQTSISGGNITTQFLAGVGYHNETSVFPGDFGDRKGSLHFNVNNMSKDQKFKLQLSGNYMLDVNQLLDRDLTYDAINLVPVAPSMYNADGSINWQSDLSGATTFRNNPAQYLYNNYKNKTSNLVSNALLSYALYPGIYIKSSFGYTNLQSDEIKIFPLSAIRPERQLTTPRVADFSNNNINSWIIEPQLNFNRNLGRGQLDILVGTTVQQNNNNGEQLTGYGHNSDLLLEDIKSAPNILIKSTTNAVYRYNAIFSRINYRFKDKYILNLTARRDGSSRFGRENRFHNFGAVGGAWIFSQETLLKRNLPWFSFGKLRTSYGTTGSDQITDYRFLNLYDAITPEVPYQGVGGLTVNGLSNPYLQWEETKKLQLGLDLGFVNDRILFNVNYFRNRSSNQLMTYALPIITGFGVIDRNFPATLQNTGWELSVNITSVKTKVFTWTTAMNFTSYKNKLIKFPGIETSSYATQYIIGEPITYVKKLHFSGVDPISGLFQFQTRDGKLTSTPDLEQDNTVLLDLNPQFYGGVQNSITFKGVQLDFLLQFVKQLAQNYIFGRSPGNFSYGTGNQPTTVFNRWQKPGDVTFNQKYSSNFSQNDQFGYASSSSDAAFSDASYIRMKNVSLTWQIPRKWLNVAHLRNAGLYILGQNLFTITSYKGLDPETKSSITLPPLKTITIGIKASL